MSKESKFKFSLEHMGEFQLVVAVVLFGASFILQRNAMFTGIGPIAYNACRFAISVVVMLVADPIVGPMVHTAVEQDEDQNKSESIKLWNYRRDLVFWGCLCGIFGFGGSLLQQIGLVNLTAGKTGFITGMFVIFVPIVEWLTPGFGADLTARSWLACLGSLFGLYLLSGCTQSECLNGATGRSEIIVFISMLFWTVGIMFSDIGAKKVNSVSLMTVNFIVVTVFSIIAAILYESEYLVYPYAKVRENGINIIMSGVIEAVAFTFSTMGQRYSSPTRASIILSLESVSCAICGYLFLDERLSYIEIVGACFMAGSGFLARDFTELVDVNELEMKKPRSRGASIVSEFHVKEEIEMELPLWRESKTFGALDSVDGNSNAVRGMGYTRIVDNRDK